MIPNTLFNKISIYIVAFGLVSTTFADPYGTILGSYNGVNVYSNGTGGYVSNEYNIVNGTNTGMKWQCVEYVNRYYLLIYNKDIRVPGHNAVDYYPNATQHGLAPYANNGTTAPAIGDILCFSGGNPNYGHVAIVREVGSNYLKVAQQNVTNNAGDVNFNIIMTVIGGYYNVSGSTIGASYICQGWLRTSGTISPPVLISPGTSTPPGPVINTLTPTFQWQAVTGAVRYGLYVRDSTTGILIIDIENITGASYTPPSGLLTYSHIYRWNMRSFSSNGTPSAFSSKLYFQTFSQQTIQPPVLISPGSSSPPGPIITTLTPTFQWQAVTGAVRYGLYVRDSTTGVLIIDNENITGTSYIHSLPLINNHLYKWNMRAFNSSGLPSDFSQRFYFIAPNFTKIQTISEIIPENFVLYQNYPNPFNPNTKIKFDMPKMSFIQLIIYDILGRDVAVLVNEELKAGEYLVEWPAFRNAANYPSGIYFCKFIAGQYSKTIKITLIK